MIRFSNVVLIIILAGRSAVTFAGDLLCKDSAIVVHGGTLDDMQDACDAASSAGRFFAATGLHMPKDVRITIGDDSPSTFLRLGETGSYDAHQNAIRVLGYQFAVRATEGNDPGLGRITTRAHWQSYIAHELAHAAIHAGCDRACPSRAIHEYVAAVAQIASLPDDQRSVLLAHYIELDSFHQLSEISETYYAINPHYFAVKSYKHFQKLSDPQAFFRAMLNRPD